MASTNPEIEAQLDSLAKLCCDRLSGDAPVNDERFRHLAKALLMSGFEQKDGAPLSAELEKRIRHQCKEPAIHRGAQIKAVTDLVQGEFRDLVRWDSQQPSTKNSTAPKAANISSSTGA